MSWTIEQFIAALIAIAIVIYLDIWLARGPHWWNDSRIMFFSVVVLGVTQNFMAVCLAYQAVRYVFG